MTLFIRRKLHAKSLSSLAHSWAADVEGADIRARETHKTIMKSDSEMRKLSSPEISWPAGRTMDVSCPKCDCTVTTQITMVREDHMPLRPESCDMCGADFEVYPDGKTTVVSIPGKGDSAEQGKINARLFQSLTFDPNGARDWPYTTEVEALLTVAWLHVFEDGTQQFIDEDQAPSQIYSPRLGPEELELFCKVNIDSYRNFHSEHEAELDHRKPVQMTPFW
ncbi:hypothetical protein [Pseudomonas sp. PS02290]|uniref:hypothetical protein n=1 Tax=Pseudomonas sp. PS02290 TaxID=2991430 RepID=UPI00249B359A|nr:hypothetical protein [Pseudomonas sp. PS02290]